MPRAHVSDVRALNGFPGEDSVSDLAIEQWLKMRAGELDMLLRRRGVPLPLVEPTEESDPLSLLWYTLRMAETYGAAAMLESAPIMGLDPDRMAPGVNMYLQEYTRIYNQISQLTQDDLIAFGIIEPTPVPTTSVTIAGLTLVGNSHVSQPAPDWRDAYPVRRWPL